MTPDPPTELDLFDPAFVADPFPALHRLRHHDPVHRTAVGFWILTRYDDVAAKRVAMMHPHIESLASGPLDRAGRQPRFDVIASLAHPLPSLVICEMLGVPEADRPRFSLWTEDIAFLLAPRIEPARLETGERAAGEFMDSIRALMAERRRTPGDDLLSALLAAEEGGDRLSADELVATVVFLFSAGHQTTRDLTGNALLGLLRHPEQRDLLVAEPGRLRDAVEECLRYDPSVTMTPRRALEDVAIRDTTILEVLVG